jgi:hypothetical protein
MLYPLSYEGGAAHTRASAEVAQLPVSASETGGRRR